ncbi:hypothetical protein [Microcoleus vaginatus]|uniref:hypothetical protein n=1 Tax=Microcoleus vaginatus TaxID=119532 RepID=UPI001F617AB7
MQLVERQVIKPNHRFYPQADRLSLLSNKLYNCDNYIYGQNLRSKLFIRSTNQCSGCRSYTQKESKGQSIARPSKTQNSPVTAENMD